MNGHVGQDWVTTVVTKKPVEVKILQNIQNMQRETRQQAANQMSETKRISVVSGKRTVYGFYS